MNGSDTNRRGRLWGIVATVAFHALLLIILLTIGLTYTPGQDEERVWPPVDEDEILYAGEYVKLGDTPDPDMTDDNTPADLAPEPDTEPSPDNSAPGDPAEPPVSASEPSPVKVKPSVKPDPGPTAEERARAEQAERERESARRVSERVKFGQKPTPGGGKPGAPQGNSPSGALSGAPGTDLHGRSLASWHKPSGRNVGTIVVQVTVNRKGAVTRARYVSGTGPVAADAAARRSCEQAAMRSTFSVADSGPESQVGTITYRFE